MDNDTICGVEPPEVCGPDAEDSKKQHLLSQTTNDDDTRITKFIKRDKPLLIAIAGKSAFEFMCSNEVLVV